MTPHPPPPTPTPQALRPWRALLSPAHPRHAALFDLTAPLAAPDDLSHDLAHVLRVYRWCVALAPEANASPDLAGACALIHDLVNVPKDSPDRPLASEISAAAAAPWLAAAGYSPAEVTHMVEAVRTCSWSRGLAPTSGLGQALQDADRLDAIGALGIARTFACAQRMHHPNNPSLLLHPTDPAASTRPLDDRAFAADHFRRKLLLLASGMHTPSARAEATRRHALMLTFLDALYAEALSPT
jgi:uncharacterized protein